MSRSRGPGPNVKFPPPILFAAGFFAGWLLDRRALHLWPDAPRPLDRALDVAGWLLVAGGLALTYWGIATFRRLRTSVYPNRDASTLVSEGPYRFTRNPMYSGLTVAYVGGSIVIGSAWPLLHLPLVLALLYVLVIAREERHLTEAFGDSYRDYQRRVGRWLTL